MKSLNLDFKGRNVRMWSEGDDQCWVASDVASALGIKGWEKQVRKYEDYEKGVRQWNTPGGMQPVVVLKEPGVYRMILGSRKKESVDFKKWLFCDVLPSIRKTGAYSPGAPGMTNDGILQLLTKMEEKRLSDSHFNNKMIDIILSFSGQALAAARHHRPLNPNQSTLPFPGTEGLQIGHPGPKHRLGGDSD